MKPFSLILLVITGILFSQCESPQSNNCSLQINTDSTSTYKVLFIGNSHTGRNNVPRTVQKIAESMNDSLVYTRAIKGGTSLYEHLQRKASMDAIKTDKWDFVVIQPVSVTQALPEHMLDTALIRYAKMLMDTIWNNYRETKIIFYMTHATKDGVLSFNYTDWCEQDTQVCNFNGMLERMRWNYIHPFGNLEAEIAPCGIMWKLFMDSTTDVELFDDDGKHALPTGSYISACTIYSTLFKRRPEKVYVPDNVDAKHAEKIQEIISSALFDCNPDWKTYLIN